MAALPSGVLGTAYDFRERAAQCGVRIPQQLSCADLTVDLDAYQARRSGRLLELSPRQVELLALFVAAPGRVWSRHQLHWVCWADVRPSRRVDVQLCRIRTKVGRPLFRNIRDRGWALHTG